MGPPSTHHVMGPLTSARAVVNQQCERGAPKLLLLFQMRILKRVSSESQAISICPTGTDLSTPACTCQVPVSRPTLLQHLQGPCALTVDAPRHRLTVFYASREPSPASVSQSTPPKTRITTRDGRICRQCSCQPQPRLLPRQAEFERRVEPDGASTGPRSL